MKRWQRLRVYGDKPERVQGLISNIAKKVESNEYHPDAYDSHLWFRTSECTDIVLLQHFEIPHPFGDVTRFAQKAVDSSLEYLYGDWRDGYLYDRKRITREQTRKRLEWIVPYRRGLLFAMCLDDAERAERLAQWPDTDVHKKDLEFSPADTDYHILLARYLCGKPLKDSSRLAASIKTGTRRRPKALLEALEAIEAGDPGKFSKKLERYLKGYLKSGIDPDDYETYVSMEGSLLWQTARRSGLELPSLPVELADLVVTAESAGLVRTEVAH